MSITVSLQGTNYAIPETNERAWGANVTSYLQRLGNILNLIAGGSGSAPLLLLLSASSSLAAAATLTPTAIWHRVQGSGGAVTLSASTSIADGVNGQLLLLSGEHATNTVKIQDASNVSLNGDVTLSSSDLILLAWDSTLSAWREIARSN